MDFWQERKKEQEMKRHTALRILISFVFAVLNFYNIPAAAEGLYNENAVFQNGACFTTWEKERFASPGAGQALEMLADMGVDHIQIIVTWYQDSYDSIGIKSTKLTPSDPSVIKAIINAQEMGLKVMLKPQVDIINNEKGKYWRGNIGSADDKGWERWFEEYERFIVHYAGIAQKYGVEIFCVGTELSLAAREDGYWRQIISSVRGIYSGELIYAANWDNYRNIKFWKELDYAGIDAYFPLTQKSEPSVEEIKKGWKKWTEEIDSWHSAVNMPIVFTEIGYPSSAHAASNPWENGSGNPDVDMQTKCYKAFFGAVWGKAWLSGVYWWNFNPSIYGGGMYNRYFTPLNKPAAKILKKAYRSDRLVLRQLDGLSDVFEMTFAEPRDLKNRFIQFRIKAGGGVKAVKFVLRDSFTRCSPSVSLNGVGERWKSFSINIEKKAFDFLDTRQVESIKFKILPAHRTGKEETPALFIEEIEFF